jgi:ubiquinone/menaquinone biosynthesis C-methylase UbiE
MHPQQAVIDRWSGAAPFWEKHREMIRAMFEPVSQALMEEALIGEGQRVLDVATGPGEPALSVAAHVGASGEVVGVDPIAGMVAAARRAAERAGFRNARFEVASADQLAFPSDSFDAVISRFGAMFFPAPVEGLREMLRVLKPGRKMALAVWAAVENNPFFHVVSGVLDRFVAPPPVEPDAPDAFRYSSPGKLLALVQEAGAVMARERVLTFPIEARVSVEEFWAVRWEMSEKLRERVAMLSAGELDEVKRQAIEALGEYSRDGVMSFSGSVLIVSGTKSAE